MEREGSGFDLMYNVLPSGERPAPVLEEGADSVRVTVQGSQLKPELARPIAKAGARSQRTQRERVAVGVLAQSGSRARLAASMSPTPAAAVPTSP